jgi:hypothetical protein
LKGTGGWYEVRVFFTTITISAASICGLACGAYLERHERRIIPLSGIVLAPLAALLLITGIWFDPRSDNFWKTTLIIVTFSVAFAHVSLLSMARLANRFRWSVYVSYFFVFGVALMIVWVILNEPRNQWFWKLLAIAAIGAAAMTVLTPIFHWLSRHDVKAAQQPGAEVESIDEEIARLKARIGDLEKQKQDLQRESS